MRAAVIVCEQDCVKGQLDYAFREDYESSSGGPSLNPSWGEGTFDTSLGPYRYFQSVREFRHYPIFAAKIGCLIVCLVFLRENLSYFADLVLVKVLSWIKAAA